MASNAAAPVSESESGASTDTQNKSLQGELATRGSEFAAHILPHMPGLSSAKPAAMTEKEWHAVVGLRMFAHLYEHSRSPERKQEIAGFLDRADAKLFINDGMPDSKTIKDFAIEAFAISAGPDRDAEKMAAAMEQTIGTFADDPNPNAFDSWALRAVGFLCFFFSIVMNLQSEVPAA